MSLKQNLAVKIVAGYAAFGLVLMEILYLGVWCRPFSQYWAVPPDSGRLEPSLEGSHQWKTLLTLDSQFNAPLPRTISSLTPFSTSRRIL